MVPPINASLISTNVPLADKNWFGTGGNARFYSEPHTALEFQAALAFAKECMLPVFILGDGANVLIHDNGFDGLIIRPQLTAITITNQDNQWLVTAQAGTSMHHLIELCLQNQLIGLEEFSGIPGCVGGAVYINLHYFEFLIAQFLVKAEIIDTHTGTITTVDNAWFNFGYNYSTLHHKTAYLISATFSLKKETVEGINFARGRRYEIIRHRQRRYPQSGTCGSFFRLFHDDEVSLVVSGKKNGLCWLLS